MSSNNNKNNGKKRQTIADLEKEAYNLENNLGLVDKSFLNKIVKTICSIMVRVQHGETGIFSVIIKWFRLYVKVYISINPDDGNLLKYYEGSVPTIISYIIGCLQYKSKETANYHFKLLEIFEDILENVPTNAIKQIEKFEIGTIGCLWNPIDMAGDFNTQSKALKILSVLLKQFDEGRQNEELKYIKWTNLNLFQDKLKTIVQATELAHVIENSTRELLNNYNMNLSKNILVYSFFCSTSILDHKYKFYKPLNLQHFWIDINYRPKTLSYMSRFKMHSHAKYENVNVILRIQTMKLENNILFVYFKPPGEFSKYSQEFTNLKDNLIQFTLAKDEVTRLKENSYIMDYFNRFEETVEIKPKKSRNEHNKIFNLLKNEMSINIQESRSKKSSSKSGSEVFKRSNMFRFDSSPESNTNNIGKTSTALRDPQAFNINELLVESPKTSRKPEKEMDKHPIRKLRDRKKFFTSFIDDTDDEIICKKTKRKRAPNRKSRQSKSLSKQVCKVTPTIDLTKIENADSKKENIENKISNNNRNKPISSLINSQDCSVVLKEVADIYKVQDLTYARPCQSYRNFKLQSNLTTQNSNANNSSNSKSRKKKITNLENGSSVEKMRKLTLKENQENKENINPKDSTIMETKIQSLSKNKSIISPHLFETQCSDETLPLKKLRASNQGLENVHEKVIEIDLTPNQRDITNDCVKQKENIVINHDFDSSSDSMECDEIRGLNDHTINYIPYICTPTKSILNSSSRVTTPRPTSRMNISDLNDSDMEITQIYCYNKNDIMEQTNHNKNIITLQNNPIDMELTEHFKGNLDENTNNPRSQIQKENKIKNVSLEMPDYYRECVIFQKRLDDEESERSDEDTDGSVTFCISHLKNQQNLVKQNTSKNVIMTNPEQKNNVLNTPDKTHLISSNVTTTMSTNCEVTPTAIIVRQIQVSTKKSIILRNNKPKETFKANKSLNGYFQHLKSQNDLKRIQNNEVPQNHIAKKFKETDLNENLALIKYKEPQTRNYIGQKALQLKQNLENDTTNIQHIQNLPKTSIYHETEHSKLIARNDHFQPIINLNLYETPSTNLATQTLDNEDLEEHLEQESSPTNSNSSDSSSNYSDLYFNVKDVSFGNSESSFRNDFLKILNDYNTNLQLRLNNFYQLNLKTVSDLHIQKFCEISQAVLKKSEENNLELEQIHDNIRRLIRELERQYDKFTTKSKQFDIHKEITQRVLESLRNIDISKSMNKDYDDFIMKLNMEQNELVHKVWTKYMEKLKH